MPRLIESAPGVDRTTTGIEGLDALTGGGFPSNRAVVVCGSPGTGKTTMALQFLIEGLERGEHGVFASVDEKPRHLLEDARRLGWELGPATDRGALAVLDASSFFTAARSKGAGRAVVDARQVAGDLVQHIRTIGARRVVLDPVTSLVSPEMSRGQAYDFLRSLLHSLEDNVGCTIMLTCRGSREDSQQGSCDAVRSLASGVVELRLGRRGSSLVRTLRVRKMRGAHHDLAEQQFRIEPVSGLSIVRSDALLDRWPSLLHANLAAS